MVREEGNEKINRRGEETRRQTIGDEVMNGRIDLVSTVWGTSDRSVIKQRKMMVVCYQPKVERFFFFVILLVTSHFLCYISLAIDQISF